MTVNIFLYLKFPSNIQVKLTISPTLTVYNLKNSIEKLYGLPCEIQRLEHSGKTLEGEMILSKVGVVNGTTITVGVISARWAELVMLCLQGDVKLLQKMLSTPSQHLKEVNRLFFSLFICSARGYPSCVATILSTHKDLDLKSTTRVTGRTVLHAAVSSGSLKCVEEIKKCAGLSFEQLLYVKDRSGCSPLGCLTCDNQRMLNYINKFISSPLTMQDVEQFSSSNTTSIKEEVVENIKNVEENTFIIKNNDKSEYPTIHTGQKNNYNDESEIGANNTNTELNNKPINRSTTNDITSTEQENVKMETGDVNAALQNESNEISNTEMLNPKNLGLSRPKEDKLAYANLTRITTPVNSEREMETVSTLIVEKTEDTTVIKVGEARNVNKISEKLPILKQNGEKPTVQLHSTKVVQKTTEATLPIPSFPRQPHPPKERKKKPVAGLLMESSARKFSRTTRGSSDGNVNFPKQFIPTMRPASADSVKPLNQPKPDSETSGKVRRISIIQNPHKVEPRTDEDAAKTKEEIEVFEIEKDRIDKPWNSWIKAVSVDADSAEAESILANPTKIEQPKSRKNSLQVHNGGNNRKQSFDQWVLHKTQEQMAELQKLRDENMHKEENETELKWKHGKSFEQWKREKEEYDRLLKEQHQEDEKENRAPRKFLKGKTFEQWQKETEEKEKFDNEKKRVQQETEKAVKESKQENRRKASVAKYQQWLIDKERQAIEELQSQQTNIKRKTSNVTALSDTKSRKRSVVLKNQNV